MPSKMIVDKQKSTRSVVAVGETNADSVGERMKRELLAYLKKSEIMPDFALMMRLLGRALEDRMRAMVAADEAHEAELRDDEAPRAGRDASGERLGTQLAGLRDATSSIYGAPTAAALGIPGEIPRDPAMLLQVGRNTVGAAIRVKLPKPLLPGASLDLKVIAQQLASTCDDLAGHLADVAREQREAQVTQAAKNQSVDLYHASFTGTADIYTGFLGYTGNTELAERVRPSRRRPGTTASGDESDGRTPGTGPSGAGGHAIATTNTAGPGTATA